MNDSTTQHCTEHRQTYVDTSPRGEKHPDDRTPLAGVYDGLSLRATLFSEREVERYREDTPLTVSLTPAGECRIEGRCRTDPRDSVADGGECRPETHSKRFGLRRYNCQWTERESGTDSLLIRRRRLQHHFDRGYEAAGPDLTVFDQDERTAQELWKLLGVMLGYRDPVESDLPPDQIDHEAEPTQQSYHVHCPFCNAGIAASSTYCRRCGEHVADIIGGNDD